MDIQKSTRETMDKRTKSVNININDKNFNLFNSLSKSLGNKISCLEKILKNKKKLDNFFIFYMAPLMLNNCGVNMIEVDDYKYDRVTKFVKNIEGCYIVKTNKQTLVIHNNTIFCETNKDVLLQKIEFAYKIEC